MHRFSTIRCSICRYSFPLGGCAQRVHNCHLCIESRQFIGSIEVLIHQCSRCGREAGYAILDVQSQADLLAYSQLSYGYYEQSMYSEQDRIHLFSRWLANQPWWQHDKEHIEAVLNTLSHQGDPAGFTEFLEYLWKMEN